MSLAGATALPDNKIEITSDSVNVNKTDWGYIIGPGLSAIRRAKTGEDIATAGCLVFGGIAVAQWILPGVQLGLEVITFKMAASLVFLSVAFKLFLISRSGLLKETQIDLDEREIRTVRCNKSRVSRTLEDVNFRDIGSIYVEKVPGTFMLYHLYVKPIRSRRAIQIAAGPERLMTEMCDNLRAVVRPRGAQKRPDPMVR